MTLWILVVMLIKPVHTSECLKGDVVSNDTCYYLPDQSLFYNWTDGKRACSEQNANMLSPKDVGTMQDLSLLFSSFVVWLGLRYDVYKGNFVWNDGSEYEAHNTFWITDEPNNYIGVNSKYGEDCTMIKNDGWNDAFCGLIYPIICEQILFSSSMVNACPDTSQWQLYMGKCYHILKNVGIVIKASWYQAIDLCRNISKNATLIMPKTREEMEFIKEMMQIENVIYIWIGLDDNQAEGVYVWQDGSVLRQPIRALDNNYTFLGDNSCVIAVDHQWYTMRSNCAEKHTVVCQRQLIKDESSTRRIQNVEETETSVESCNQCSCNKFGNVEWNTGTSVEHVDTTGKEVTEKLDSLKKSLTIDRTKLSSTKRRKTSANDDRQSSRNMGYIAVSIIVTVVGCIMLLDLLPGH